MGRLIIAVLVAVVAPGIAAAQPKIVIDPGHGGSDPGAVGNSMQEKNINLDVSKRFKTLLDADTADDNGGGKWVVRLTRSDDTYVSLAGRSAYSNNQGADRFMSIHSNAFSNTTANGTETFSYASTGTGAALRNLVQAEMIAAWGLTNRGNKVANFAVLRDTAAPAELHELAFITNAGDAAKLASPTQRQKAAEAHLRAIQRHYNITPYIPGTPEPLPDSGDIDGRVVDDLGPVEGASVLLDGDKEVITAADGTFTFAQVAVGSRAITVTSPKHEEKMVEVSVAKGVRAETEIELVRNRTGEPPIEEPPTDAGGCSTGNGVSFAWIALVGLAVFARRRRSR